MNSSLSKSAWVPAPFGPRWLRNWIERHQHPFSFYIHLIGIPMTVAALPAWVFGGFWWAAGLFVVGYALQFIGHAVEGNDPGEVVAVKRLLGLPYVAIAPKPCLPPTMPTSSNNPESPGRT